MAPRSDHGAETVVCPHYRNAYSDPDLTALVLQPVEAAGEVERAGISQRLLGKQLRASLLQRVALAAAFDHHHPRGRECDDGTGFLFLACRSRTRGPIAEAEMGTDDLRPLHDQPQPYLDERAMRRVLAGVTS